MCLVDLEWEVSYKACDDGDNKQVFYFKRFQDNPSSLFQIVADGSKRCIEMDTGEQFTNSIFANTACIDRWVVQENGVLRNVGEGKCIGRNGVKLTAVDCNSGPIQTWNPVEV